MYTMIDEKWDENWWNTKVNLIDFYFIVLLLPINAYKTVANKIIQADDINNDTLELDRLNICF